MKKIKLGVIGLGLFFRKTHFFALSAPTSKFAVTGIYSSDVRKFRRIIRSFPQVKYFAHPKEMLSDPEIEAVVACVPIPKQYRIACQVIKAHKPLLFEKPMAADLRQAAVIKDLATANGVPVMVAESFRYFQHFRDLKILLDRKSLGKVEYVQVQAIKRFDRNNPYYSTGWRVHPRGYPGILWDAGIHVVSLMRFLFGSFSVRHKILTSHDRSIGRHDTVSANLKFSGGIEASFLMSYALFGSEKYFLTVYCQRGRVKCGMNSLLIENGSTIMECGSQENVYPQIYNDFYRLVMGQQKPLYPITDAYEDLKALDSLVKK